MLRHNPLQFSATFVFSFLKLILFVQSHRMLPAELSISCGRRFKEFAQGTKGLLSGLQVPLMILCFQRSATFQGNVICLAEVLNVEVKGDNLRAFDTLSVGRNFGRHGDRT